MIKRILKKLYLTIFIFIVSLLLLSHASERVSYLARRFITLPVRNFITYFTNIIPAPVFEIVGIILLVLIPIFLFRIIRGEGSALPLLTILSIFILGYAISIGIDATSENIKGVEISHSEYVYACEIITEKLLSIEKELDENREEIGEMDEDFLSTLNIKENIRIPKIKRSYISKVLTRLGTLSYYSPFTVEIVINDEQPEAMKRFSASHELAHYLGYIREDEASFYAFCLLLSTNNSYNTYSAYLYALVSVGEKISDTSREDYLKLYEKLPPRVKKDLKNRSIFLSDEGEGGIGDTLNDNALLLVDSRGAESYNATASLIAKFIISSH